MGPCLGCSPQPGSRSEALSSKVDDDQNVPRAVSAGRSGNGAPLQFRAEERSFPI
jgi:hypothetical protein